jgi:hypothetical protein
MSKEQLQVNKECQEYFGEFNELSTILGSRKMQGVPPAHEHLNIGKIKLHSSTTFI